MIRILTIANSRGVYQSSDYQLTDSDTGASVSDPAESKQWEAGFKGLRLQFALTGIAAAGGGARGSVLRHKATEAPARPQPVLSSNPPLERARK